MKRSEMNTEMEKQAWYFCRYVRRVPPYWEHPKEWVWKGGLRHDERFVELDDEPVDGVWDRWFEAFTAWKADHPHAETPYDTFCKAYECPPDPQKYRPSWKPDEMTWYQLYHTGGIPLTPPFASQEELIEHLVEEGELNSKPWNRELAEWIVYGKNLVQKNEDGSILKLGEPWSEYQIQRCGE